MKNKSNLEIVQDKNFKDRPSLPAGTKLLSFIGFERGLFSSHYSCVLFIIYYFCLIQSYCIV